jgi:DNA-binding NarL/FixJ family response regulator
MPELSVAIIASDNQQREFLQELVDGTGVARTVHTCSTYPFAASDPVMHGLHNANSVVIIVDIPADDSPWALHTMELLHQEMPDAAIFAVSDQTHPAAILEAMRAGANEFIVSPVEADQLLKAFARIINRGIMPRAEPPEPKPIRQWSGASRAERTRFDFAHFVGYCLLIIASFLLFVLWLVLH